MEYINIQKVMFMKGNSKTIKEMAQESINLQMEISTKGNSKIIEGLGKGD